MPPMATAGAGSPYYKCRHSFFQIKRSDFQIFLPVQKKKKRGEKRKKGGKKEKKGEKKKKRGKKRKSKNTDVDGDNDEEEVGGGGGGGGGRKI